jgi:hypothetical protein
MYRARPFVALNDMQVLANGEEVKLQRNALSVVEYGPEDLPVRVVCLGRYTSSIASAWPEQCLTLCLQEDSSEEMTEAREPQIGEHSCLAQPHF